MQISHKTFIQIQLKYFFPCNYYADILCYLLLFKCYSIVVSLNMQIDVQTNTSAYYVFNSCIECK